VASSPDTGAHSADEGSHAQSHPYGDSPHAAAASQNCAFCGGAEVVWMHPLATDRVQFRKFGKDNTVPSSWALCESCERLYADGEDDELIALMKKAGGWIWQGADVEDVLRKPVDIFREADLGRRPIEKP
jgi:hypothetical protein